MGTYKKADFYYGAFLSLLFNNGITPAMIEKEGELSRRRFLITTNKGEYDVYCKYVCNSTHKINPVWAFTFSPKEVNELHMMIDSNKDVIFALLCLQKDITSSTQELAIVRKSTFKECVNLDTYKDSTPRISVKSIKGSNYLYIYGTNRSGDKAIRIERNGINTL